MRFWGFPMTFVIQSIAARLTVPCTFYLVLQAPPQQMSIYFWGFKSDTSSCFDCSCEKLPTAARNSSTNADCSWKAAFDSSRDALSRSSIAFQSRVRLAFASCKAERSCDLSDLDKQKHCCIVWTLVKLLTFQAGAGGGSRNVEGWWSEC